MAIFPLGSVCNVQFMQTHIHSRNKEKISLLNHLRVDHVEVSVVERLIFFFFIFTQQLQRSRAQLHTHVL